MQTDPSEHVCSSLETGEVVDILVAEYNATRAEIHTRYAALTQLIAIGSASFLAIVGVMLSNSFITGLILLLVLLVILWYGLNTIDIETFAAADHLINLERKINNLANSQLLTWEHRRGLRAVPMSVRIGERFFEQKNSIYILFKNTVAGFLNNVFRILIIVWEFFVTPPARH